MSRPGRASKVHRSRAVSESNCFTAWSNSNMAHLQSGGLDRVSCPRSETKRTGTATQKDPKRISSVTITLLRPAIGD